MYVEKGHNHPKRIDAKTILGKLQDIYKNLDNGRLKGKKQKAINEATPWYNKLKTLPDSREKRAAIGVYNKILNY